MIRSAVVRGSQLVSRRFQSTASAPVLAQAEQTFVQLSKEEQHSVVERLNQVMKADWKTVSIEDKRAAYFASYGAHNGRRPHVKPGDNMKVFVGVVATIALSLTISTLVRSSVPKQRTLTKEWQEASNVMAKEKNINPISGVSSEGYQGKGFVQSN